MDNLFKTLLIIILVAFLYLYYENSNNNRYSETNPLAKMNISRVFDKKTGTQYTLVKEKIVMINLINGTRKELEQKILTKKWVMSKIIAIANYKGGVDKGCYIITSVFDTPLLLYSTYTPSKVLTF